MMKKKEHRKEKEDKDAETVMPRGQLVRLKKLFSIKSGNEANSVNHSRLN